MAKQTLCTLLGIDHPIIQAPMAGGVITADFVAQVSNFGLLGSIPTGYLSLEKTRVFINKVRESTTQPFQLNLFAEDTHTHPVPFEKPKELKTIEEELGIKAPQWCTIPSQPSTSTLAELAIDHNIPIVSTTFGLLNPTDTARMRHKGIVLMVTVNCTDDAERAIIEGKAQVLIYQNSNAGGHRGGLDTTQPYSSTHDILALKERYPDAYWVQAGGIVSRNDVQEALAFGFDGVQIGSAFLTTKESTATQQHKQAIVEAKRANDTVVTHNITGKDARGLSNALSQLTLSKQFPYPQLHYATKTLRDYARQNNLRDYQALWAGTGVEKITNIPSLLDYMRSLQ